MIDLLGFWVAVTLIVAPTVLLVYWVIEQWVGHEVKVLSQYKVRFNPFSRFLEKVMHKSGHCDVLVALVLFIAILVSMVVLGCAAFAVDCDAGEPIGFLDHISEAALFITPVTSYIAVPSILLVAYYTLVRPLLVKAFALVERINKL